MYSSGKVPRIRADVVRATLQALSRNHRFGSTIKPCPRHTGVCGSHGWSIRMSGHQSNKYGNILFVFCGGGCKAVIQAVAAAELVNAGLCPTHIVSSSAGSCNALGFVENPGVVG